MWGYSMTIVDFYAVIKETPKSLTVVPMTSKETPQGYLSGTSVPDAPVTDGPTSRLLKRKGYYVGTLNKANGNKLVRHIVFDWDGTPKDFNHCD